MKSRCFWPEGEPRIHAMLVDIAYDPEDSKKCHLRFSMNNRRELHGEIVLLVPREKCLDYHIGSVYAAHFKHADSIEENPDCFWPDGEPRIHAVIESISQPFDCGQFVEVRFRIDNRTEISGTIDLRIPKSEGLSYKTGMTYAAHFKLVSEMKPKNG
jgi:hypothetical protein